MVRNSGENFSIAFEGVHAATKAELESLRNLHAAALTDLRAARDDLDTLKKGKDAVAEEASDAATRVRHTAREVVQASEDPWEAAVELDVLMTELE
ncbi:hypothetical protein D1007_56831 [Hordeum vulgare]|nr:hypothetical protein D1007_56831 [Hordeum vulgare]